MITHIRGQLISKKPGQAVVEAGGLGYELAVPLGTFLALPEPPAEVALLTRLFIREESWDLFGFLSSLERESFSALTSVSRIGPRLALTIISALEPGELARALMVRDLSAIAGIKGIGVKTAERLMVELRDKAPKLAALAGLKAEELKAAPAPAPAGPEDDEAVSALVNLGYNPAEARQAAREAAAGAGAGADLGAVLRLALKALTKHR
ncbi:MAG: Holliday junction branch migration protein RuvA [Candidatus Adiutrix sp.]|jgi:Holliday junction DNA helicase RuvA|nr:Holliday junction branch migration protein RuvA [Candidatus Adiutrix sp.]